MEMKRGFWSSRHFNQKNSTFISFNIGVCIFSFEESVLCIKAKHLGDKEDTMG